MSVFAIVSVPLLVLLMGSLLGPKEIEGNKQPGWVFVAGLFAFLPYALAKSFVFNLPQTLWDPGVRFSAIFFEDYLLPLVSLILISFLPFDGRRRLRSGHGLLFVLPMCTLLVVQRLVHDWAQVDGRILFLVPGLVSVLAASMVVIMDLFHKNPGKFLAVHLVSLGMFVLAATAEVDFIFGNALLVGIKLLVLVFIMLTLYLVGGDTLEKRLAWLPELRIVLPKFPKKNP